MQVDGLGHLQADAQRRIERRHRLLKNHGDAIAADGADFGIVELEQVATLEQHLAGLDPARRRRDQAHDGQGRHALARSRLADDGDGLAFGNVEGDLIDRGQAAALAVEARGQVAHLEQGWGHGGCRRALRQ